MSRALQAVREAAIDGRLQNVIYRQAQLEKLQKVFVENAEAVERAIRKDSGHSGSEAAVEFILTLQAIKAYYETLDETEALHSEYALARGEDAAGRQDGIGIVYIVPTNYTLFYSVVVTTSAAIAAGNCVVIEVRSYSFYSHNVLLKCAMSHSFETRCKNFLLSSANSSR